MADGNAPSNDSRMVGVAGGTAAPTAGASLATITTPPRGLYRFEVHTGLAGTLAAADNSNIEARVGNTVLANLAAVGAGTHGPFVYQHALDGNTSVTVNVTAAATAGSVYHATLIITKLD